VVAISVSDKKREGFNGNPQYKRDKGGALHDRHPV
jgi:hypothetical protein